MDFESIPKISGIYKITNIALIAIKQNKEIIKNKAVFSSKYKGVHWSKWAKKWQSRTRIDGKVKHLGYFNSELEAYEAIKNINT